MQRVHVTQRVDSGIASGKHAEYTEYEQQEDATSTRFVAESGEVISRASAKNDNYSGLTDINIDDVLENLTVERS